MNITLMRRAGFTFSSFVLVLLIAQMACKGPQGPQGPPGPPGSGGGPPYVWICTPAHYPNAGGNPRAYLYVFNGSSTTANIAVNILDRDGGNLASVNIPGSSPAVTYPGQTGSTTVPLLSAHTLNVAWQTPTTSGPGFDGITHVSFTVRVTSDQPIAVSTDFGFSGFHALPCTLLPK